MTNFDILKIEVMKCTTPEEFEEVMERFRFEIFPCDMTERCIEGYTCKQCYREWLMKEVSFKK